jgi:hypothetical protein
MSRTKGPALPASVWRLGERIEQWRRTRTKRTAMAPELWSAAVVLAQRHGVYQVARALRLDFECLKRRMAEAVAVAPPPSAPSGAFVEWTGAQILSASSARGAVIELSDETSVRLTLRLGADVEVDVERVVAAFRQRGA